VVYNDNAATATIDSHSALLQTTVSKTDSRRQTLSSKNFKEKDLRLVM
jgi:hypothetical protein